MNNKPAPKTAARTTIKTTKSATSTPARPAPKVLPRTTTVAAKPATSAKPSKPATSAAPLRPAEAPKPAAPPKPKHKLVRDSFTIPKSEYAVIEVLKVRAAKLARPVKKSELLRAGISTLNGMSDKAFLAAMNSVPSLKTGRPSGANAVPPPTKALK